MKFKLLIPLLLISNLSFSQIEHKLLIGGAIGYRYTDDNSSIETVNFIQCQENLLQLNPVVGYFISKNFVVGLGFEYLYDKTKYDNYIFYSSLENGFSIAPFLRLYAPFGLFFHGELDYGTSRLSFSARTIPGSTGFIDTSESYNYRNIIGFSAGLGYSININDNFGIEPSIRYLGGKFNEKDSKNDFNRTGLLMTIGLVCFIN
jgi:long-subunit fatty acid transport protein